MIYMLGQFGRPVRETDLFVEPAWGCYDHQTGEPTAWPEIFDGRDMVVGVFDTGVGPWVLAVDSFVEMQGVWLWLKNKARSLRMDWYVGRVKDYPKTGITYHGLSEYI